MRQHPSFVIVAVLLAGASAWAQGRDAGPQQAAGAPQAPIVRTASLSGQVVDADTGAPIGGAVVRLQSRLLAAAAGRGGAGAPAGFPLPGSAAGANAGSDVVIADADGRFVFHGLPKGATQLSAAAAGYLDRAASGAPQRPIQLEDGQHLAGVRLALRKVASVSGTVLDEAGEPVVGLTVRVLRRETPQGIPRLSMTGSARTDDRGVYRLDDLPPGVVYVIAPQNQTTVPVSEAERNQSPLSAVNPLIEAMTGGTQTTIAPPGIRVGDQLWRASGDVTGPGATPPAPVNGRLAAYQTTFYPGVTQLAQALTITLRSGEERTGIDFQIRPTASARVSGVLIGPAGPSAGTMMRLVPAPGRADDDPLTVATATSAPDGAFTFVGVPTGQYVVKAQASPRGGLPANIPQEAMANMPPEILNMMQSRTANGETSYLQAPIAVGDRDVTGLALSLRPGAKLSGTVVFDGAAPRPAGPQVTNIQIAFSPIGGGASFANAQTRLAADFTFKTGNYAPGMYSPAVTGLPGPWMLRSVSVAGRETLLTGIEVGEGDLSDVVLTLFDRPSTISGVARLDTNAPLPNSTVLLVAADFRVTAGAGLSPRQQTAIVQPSGQFTLGRLLPGDYFIVAVVDEGVPVDRDLAFFESVARLGTRVSVTEGETKTQDLKIVRSLR